MVFHLHDQTFQAGLRPSVGMKAVGPQGGLELSQIKPRPSDPLSLSKRGKLHLKTGCEGPQGE
jgi:hypothetical protein